MGGTTSLFESPPIEKVLKDALQPYKLDDVVKHVKTLQQLKASLHSAKQLHETYDQNLQVIIEFLDKLSKYASPKARARWFVETYTKTMPPMFQQHAVPSPAKTALSRSSSTKTELKGDLKDVNDAKLKYKMERDELSTIQKAMNESYQNEIDRLEGVVQSQDKVKAELEKRLSRSHSTETDLKRDLKDVTHAKLKYQMESEELRQRLAKEMSDKIAKDEENLENVNIKNRPMKVAEEYENFCSNAWFLAKGKLDYNDVPNEKALIALADILKHAETFASLKANEVTNGIYSVFSQQAQEGARLLAPLTPQGKMTTMEVKKIPDGLKNAIGDFLRITADSADISVIVQEIQKASKPERMKSMVRTMKELERCDQLCDYMIKELDDYVKECARLTWKMAVQRPPMTFDNTMGVGHPWKGEKFQEVFYESQDPNNPENVVQFYVFPILKHKHATMVKGRVFVARKKDLQKTILS